MPTYPEWERYALLQQAETQAERDRIREQYRERWAGDHHE